MTQTKMLLTAIWSLSNNRNYRHHDPADGSAVVGVGVPTIIIVSIRSAEQSIVVYMFMVIELFQFKKFKTIAIL